MTSVPPTTAMENRFLRFFIIRRQSSTSSVDHDRSLDDLASHSVSYESTPPSGKHPIFVHRPLRKGRAARRRKDELDGLAIRGLSYDATLAGKPPIMGGKPLKGNGPVKLQTSRRLSSGELLVTSQDAERTLEDIREGEYIIGRKEKRLSRTSQARSPTPVAGNTMSPRLLPKASASSSPHLPVARAISHRGTKESFVALSSNGSNSMPNPPRLTSSFSTQTPDGSASTLTAESLAISRSANTRGSGQVVDHRSLLTQNEEQNTTIQALWKAEYGRLIAIYGKDGVDRNIAELNRDHHRSSSPVKTQATLDAMAALGMTLEPLSKPSFESGQDLPTRKHERLSSHKDTSSTDETSDNASTIRSSVTSTDAHPPVRTSGFAPDLPTTREDVRKVVEDMRSTYLMALEARGTERSKSKKVKRRKERASYSVGHVASKSMSKPKRPTRQSWHPSNTRPEEAPQPTPVERFTDNEKTLDPAEGPPTTSLQRADSMTLGSLMLSTPKKSASKETPKETPPSSTFVGSPETPKPMVDPPTDTAVHHQVTICNETDALAPEIAPDIDDFDIFYQDLYGPPPTAASMSSLPMRKRGSKQHRVPAAPSPPNIERTPPRRYVAGVM